MLNFESFSTGRGTKSDSSRALPIFKARTPFACLCFSRRFCFLTRYLADECCAVVRLRSRILLGHKSSPHSREFVPLQSESLTEMGFLRATIAISCPSAGGRASAGFRQSVLS